jgi:hypothetical protein
MSAQPAKIFGIQLGIDPKIIVGLLLVLAGLVYYFNAQSDDHPIATPPVATSAAPAGGFAEPASPLAVKTLAARRAAGARSNARVGLKLVAIDGSRGDVDPTLRLDLLERVHSVSPAAGLRNLFEAGSSQPVQNLTPLPKIDPKMPPKPVQPVGQQAVNTPPPPPVFSIPLKYYGFAKPTGHTTEANRGLFLDGDNILMGGEGDILEKKYLIVALTPNSARLEDVQAKQGQDLPVTPAATVQ